MGRSRKRSVFFLTSDFGVGSKILIVIGTRRFFCGKLREASLLASFCTTTILLVEHKKLREATCEKRRKKTLAPTIDSLLRVPPTPLVFHGACHAGCQILVANFFALNKIDGKLEKGYEMSRSHHQCLSQASFTTSLT